MKDNVSLSLTQTGAVTKVKCGAFSVSKPYVTMEAAAQEAVRLGLISVNQQALLKGTVAGIRPVINTFAPGITVADLFDSGFGLSAN